jgi:HSP20 family molecular chaperone IbpA
MPGVSKKDISLEMRKDSFCVSAPRGDSHYSGCFRLTHEVEPDRAEAKYEDGLLRVFAPIILFLILPAPFPAVSDG